jgi:L-lactate dehydrogenase
MRRLCGPPPATKGEPQHHSRVGVDERAVDAMTVAIVGVGAVGRAAAAAMLQRGSCGDHDLVLVDRRDDLARSVALDLDHARPVSTWGKVRAGTYEAIVGARVVVITAGTNEKDGGATDRNDPEGRLKLLDANVPVIEDVMGHVVRAAPDAVVLVATNPPDPLADLVRDLAGHGRVLSSGTYLDSSRFRTYLGHEIGVSPHDVSANVLGEHGTSAVLHWSAVTVGGVPLAAALKHAGTTLDEVRPRVEKAVRGANLDIIDGLDASQYGIGAVLARLTEAVLRDERIVAPVGSRQTEAGLTFSLPSVIGANGVEAVLEPRLDDSERNALDASIDALKSAAERLRAAR